MNICNKFNLLIFNENVRWLYVLKQSFFKRKNVVKPILVSTFVESFY